MPRITIAMIESKEFKEARRGYDQDEVDLFLDDICDEMERMQMEIASLNQQLSQALEGGAYASGIPAPLGYAPEEDDRPTSEYKPIGRMAETVKEEEDSVPEPEETSEDMGAFAQRLLNKTQQVYDDMLAEARQKADQIIADANEKAEAQLASLDDERDALEQEVETLRAAVRDYRERFLALLREQKDVLNADGTLFD